MKHVLLVSLVACGASSSPPAGSPPPAPAPAATPAQPAPVTAARAAPPPPALPAVNCAAQDQAAEYCAHNHDPCCASGGQAWVCDNARYIDWFAAQCGKQ
jgi:hypothetical protein